VTESRSRSETPARAEGTASMLSGLTHELRTPLNSILMLAELLEESLGAGGEAAAGPAADRTPEATGREARYARKIRQAAEDLLELVSQAGELARVESGRLPVEARPISTADLARRIEEGVGEAARAGEATDAAEEARAAEARIKVERTAGAPETVVTDPAKLLRAAELVAGAALYASRGGEVTVRLGSRAGGGLEIRVGDSGPPLAEDERQALFLPFAGAGPRTVRRFGGTGLGLSIAHALAELLGGSLTAEPGPEGRGCEFVLTVPAER
jgi:signal transduction histidine kinase